MARLLRVPEVATSTTTAVLAEWPVAESASFTALDAIATIETEKAVVDVPADLDGVMLRQLVQAGAEVMVGDPIALLGDAGETAADIDALLVELGFTPAAASAAPTTAPPDEGPVSVGAAPVSSPLPPVAAPAAESNGRVFSSPLARRLARDAGLEVEELTGSGPGGRIVRRDVEQAIEVRVAVPQHPAIPETPAPGAYQDVPHSRMRRAIATRLTQSTQEAPHFYLNGSARVDKLLRMRATLNETGAVKISVNDLVVLAAARAQVLVPAMNVTWLPDAVRSWSTVDIAVAVATERGLVTPVVRSVDKLTISAVAAATQDVVSRARVGRLQEDELSGGALTVTNLGGFGTESFSAIINPPQSAILAVGAAREEPVVRKGKLRVGMVMHLTLSVDHRPIDGAVAAQWMAALLAILEEPVRILA
ncbi:pyruvate dehydrogenase complex dihydrolipoamide acetyltransferase [Acidothermaceae bacterium B102]|nr:pyruvate dehydrogenase complex dihydrolipoamide acetyltransferase [Acidothermaceae bacterium B102]